MTTARYNKMTIGAIETHHVWSRCVQQAFLCGVDSETGIDYSYRREILKSLLEYQSKVFAVDVGNYSILGNHFHIILRSRPDMVETWSDEDCAWRYRMAWPQWNNAQWEREPKDSSIQEVLDCPVTMQRARTTLGSISHFLARVKQPVARVFNKERKKSGHFWDGRFGNRLLLTDEETLCCSFYCDLNQVRAGMAKSLVDSEPSGIRDRILAEQARAEWIERNSPTAWRELLDELGKGVSVGLDLGMLKGLYRDGWMAPIVDEGPLATTEDEVIAQFARQSADVASIVRERSGIRLPNIIPEHTHPSDEQDDDDLAKEGESSAASSPLEQAARKPGRLRKPGSRSIDRKYRKRLARRKSDRCFINCSWFGYLRAVQVHAENILKKKPRPKAPEEDWSATASTVGRQVKQFFAVAQETISNLLAVKAPSDSDSAQPASSNAASLPQQTRQDRGPPVG